MMRRFALAVACMIVTVSFAFSEQFFASVTKVDGNKVTYKKGKYDPDSKSLKYGEPVTTETAKDVAVTRAGGGTGGGKGKGKGGGGANPLEGGLANDVFKNIDQAKGIAGQITIADDGDNKGKIVAVNVSQPGTGGGKATKKEEGKKEETKKDDGKK